MQTLWQVGDHDSSEEQGQRQTKNGNRRKLPKSC